MSDLTIEEVEAIQERVSAEHVMWPVSRKLLHRLLATARRVAEDIARAADDIASCQCPMLCHKRYASCATVHCVFCNPADAQNGGE